MTWLANDYDRLVAKIFRSYASSRLPRLPGGWRAGQLAVSLFPPLHRVAIHVADWEPVYVDLRIAGWECLVQSPFASLPHEPHMQALFARLVHPGDIVLDVGVSFGYHAMLLSRLAGPTGQVHAFEPNAALYPCLDRTLRCRANLRLHRLALSDADGTLTLYVPDDSTMASVTDWTGGATRHLTCEQRRLDDLVRAGVVPRPDLMKVDVEGAEHRVFAGARDLLDAADAPIVIFEELAGPARHAGTPKSAAHDFLASLERPGFRFFALTRTGGVVPYDAARGAGWNDVLAIPRARASRWEEPAGGG